VVSLGVDTVLEDPVGGLQLPVESFPGLGGMIGSLAVPVLVVQEGGYSLRLAGPCVAGFLAGLAAGGLSPVAARR
jgi:acetoin utilization deacetylase AcuC-like enzyme